MQITLTSLSGDQQYLDLAYPKEFGGSVELQQRETLAVTNSGSIEVHEVWFEGACLFNTEIKTHDKFDIKLRCNNFCWLMSFVLQGEIEIIPDHPILLKKGNYNTLYSHTPDINLSVLHSVNVFTICLTRPFINKVLGEGLLAQHFENDKQKIAVLIKNELIDTRLNTLIKDMLKTGRSSHIRRILLESKILEMLSYQLEKLENKKEAIEAVNNRDLERLNNAKSIIELNLQTPCSLIELARKTGLNDFKLKKGFKEQFGHTVFGYLAEVRMEKAYALLKAGHTVSEVSEIVGYKNPHHFTAAFKKKFAVLPSQVGKIMFF